MEKKGKIHPERVIKLLKENGILISAEQAEELLMRSAALEALELAEARQLCEPQIVKGYKVYVQYENISEEEMKEKRFDVAKMVAPGDEKIEANLQPITLIFIYLYAIYKRRGYAFPMHYSEISFPSELIYSKHAIATSISS